MYIYIYYINTLLITSCIRLNPVKLNSQPRIYISDKNHNDSKLSQKVVVI